jgi:phospholipid/cholesterol/gamma-HCH transport system permease protein
MSAPALRARNGGPVVTLSAHGNWDAAHVDDLERLAATTLPLARKIDIEIDPVVRLDTYGVWALASIMGRARSSGMQAEWHVGDQDRLALLSRMEETLSAQRLLPRPTASIAHGLERLGRSTERGFADGLHLLNLLGRVVVCGVRGFASPVRWHLSSVVHHIDCVGLRAIPIIALMTFLIGCIIAQQGFVHFARFSATDYVVDLVTLLVLREIGVLLVIIMVAGRSGSAYTAEIGSMKMREEIDALRTMGLEPVEYLVFPRILALVIAAPMLTLLGNFAALYGAGVVAVTYGGMSPDFFLERLRESATTTHLEIGLIKAPVMALVIGCVSALEGMKVSGSAESLGKGATSSVVRSIFLVIVLDGLFAILFATMGM